MSATPVAHVKGVVQQRHLASLQGHPVIKTHHERVRLKQQGRFAKATGRYRRTRRKRPAGPNGERWRKLLENASV